MPTKEHRNKREANRSSHKSSHHESAEKEPGFLVSRVRRWWFELTAIGLLAMGVFLLLEKLEIKAFVWRTLVNCVDVVRVGVSDLVSIFSSIKTSNLVGIVLVLVGVGMIAHSLRGRAIRRHPRLPLEDECPECHKNLDRLKRRRVDRLLGFVLRIRIKRFHCSKCSFQASVWQTRSERL